MTTIYADLGVSLIKSDRMQELIPAFLDVIKDSAEYVAIRIPAHAMEDDEAAWWYGDDASSLFIELCDILDSYSPDGYYFGTAEGDDDDFGYWRT